MSRANPRTDKRRAWEAEYRKKNRKKITDAQQEQRTANRDEYNKQACSYYHDAPDKQVSKRRVRKLEAIKYLGGKCEVCGCMPHPAAMDFHHRDETTKEDNPSTMIGSCSWARVLAELDKCVLVCSNCHREIHTDGAW